MKFLTFLMISFVVFTLVIEIRSQCWSSGYGGCVDSGCNRFGGYCDKSWYPCGRRWCFRCSCYGMRGKRSYIEDYLSNLTFDNKKSKN
ncbi:unnamed protein product [Brachionus calyciflorus]|uniref:Uncharacterized protein n=1 Tax=Brachionus calyciflorus TaxID=104777 RepID=A0A814C1A2_9BILA|nr:unnamed protein product [Brachionus calyciflorus]